MNATFHRVVASLILVVGVISMLCGQIPDWFATHKDARYPSEQYIIGVGSGTGDNAADAAKKAAQLDLVSQIRVQVQAQVKNVSESYQFNKNEQLYSEFRSTVRQLKSRQRCPWRFVHSPPQTCDTTQGLCFRNPYPSGPGNGRLN